MFPVFCAQRSVRKRRGGRFFAAASRARGAESTLTKELARVSKKLEDVDEAFRDVAGACEEVRAARGREDGPGQTARSPRRVPSVRKPRV